jgi:hypothetical protein
VSSGARGEATCPRLRQRPGHSRQPEGSGACRDQHAADGTVPRAPWATSLRRNPRCDECRTGGVRRDRRGADRSRGSGRSPASGQAVAGRSAPCTASRRSTAGRMPPLR